MKNLEGNLEFKESRGEMKFIYKEICEKGEERRVDEKNK